MKQQLADAMKGTTQSIANKKFQVKAVQAEVFALMKESNALKLMMSDLGDMMDAEAEWQESLKQLEIVRMAHAKCKPWDRERLQELELSQKDSMAQLNVMKEKLAQMYVREEEMENRLREVTRQMAELEMST